MVDRNAVCGDVLCFHPGTRVEKAETGGSRLCNRNPNLSCLGFDAIAVNARMVMAPSTVQGLASSPSELEDASKL